jgi:endoglucanase
MRYFLDLSEIVEAGGDPSSIEITANYMQSGTVDGLKVWDEENNIYYLSVLFNDGQLYPGGQSQYKSEVQVRLTYSGGPWDPSNDPSYEGLATGTASLDTNIALYEGGNLVFGTEPPAGDNAGQSVVISGASASSGSSSGSTGSSSAGGSGESGDLSLSVKYDSSGGNSISGSMEIKNLSDSAISFSGLELKYYLTNDSGSAMTFDCYYAGMNGTDGAYSEVKGISGTFEDASGTDTDTCLVMSFPSSGTIDSGATVTVNFSIHYSDWSNMTTSNDYSMADVGNIVIVSGGSVIYGTEP